MDIEIDFFEELGGYYTADLADILEDFEGRPEGPRSGGGLPMPAEAPRSAADGPAQAALPGEPQRPSERRFRSLRGRPRRRPRAITQRRCCENPGTQYVSLVSLS